MLVFRHVRKQKKSVYCPPLAAGEHYPEKVAFNIAYAVGAKAQEEGLAPVSAPEELRENVADTQWFPEYAEYEL